MWTCRGAGTPFWRKRGRFSLNLCEAKLGYFVSVFVFLFLALGYFSELEFWTIPSRGDVGPVPNKRYLTETNDILLEHSQL